MKRLTVRERKKITDADTDINSLLISCVLDDEINNYNTEDEINHTNTSEEEEKFWLSDTVAQCHIRKAKDNDSGTSAFSVKMGNNSKVDVLRKEDIVLEDDIKISLTLKDVRIVK